MRKRYEDKKLESKLIQIDDITMDYGIHSRHELSGDTVQAYAAAVEAGAQFPPVQIVSDGDISWLWDGFHRCEAYRRAGITEIPALVRRGNRVDAIVLAAGANAEHGLPRNLQDIDRAAEQLDVLVADGFLAATNDQLDKTRALQSERAPTTQAPAGQDSDEPRSAESLIRTARAVANGEAVGPIGPETARDVSMICGTTVVSASGRRFLFGREKPVDHDDLIGSERSIADDYYAFRNQVEPMYWIAQRVSPEEAVASIPLAARDEAWDSLSVAANWMHRAAHAWTRQFRDPNRMSLTDGSSPEDDAFGSVMEERWAGMDRNEHRYEYDQKLINDLCRVADRLSDHLAQGENILPGRTIAQGVESALDSLINGASVSIQTHLSTELAKISLERLVDLGRSNEMPDQVRREDLSKDLQGILSLVDNLSASH